MKKVLLAGLLAILVLATAANHTYAQASPVAITLERTACFGSCPIYAITIYEDGTVKYTGTKFVDVMGEQTSQIDPAIVKQMVAAFEAAGYFDWKEAYDTMNVTDMPYIITSVTSNGKTHKITRYVGDGSAPLALPFLETWIDDMTNSQLWTGAESNLSFTANFIKPAVATLQRGACFGKCPQYSVVLFEDGTVIYTGIANVSKIGVYEFKVDASAVAHIAEIAKITGYFDWSESYEKVVMTDQPTTITSVQSSDNAKRIVRYGGDPNAPIGLVQLEDSIDKLIADQVK